MQDRSAYPAPDRSKQTVNLTKDEDGVVDIGWSTGVLRDGRPFRGEMWAQDGISMMTYFFSSIGLSELSEAEILDLVQAEGLLVFREGAPRRFTAKPFTDDAGAAMWSVNVVVGDEDGTFVGRTTALRPY